MPFSRINLAAHEFAFDEVFDVPMRKGNAADASTIRDYFITCSAMLWTDGEAFSGKRPFGNSGWERDVYTALADNGYMHQDDYRRGDRIIKHAFDKWRAHEAVKATRSRS
jgi:hypothetical protein